MAEWTEDDVRKMIMDPRYTGVTGLPPLITEDQWIESNAKLIGEMGVKPYLKASLALIRAASQEVNDEQAIFHTVNSRPT